MDVEQSSIEEEVIEQLARAVQCEIKRAEATERSERNRDFVQVYRAHMRAFRIIIRENPSAAEIFYFIIEHMDSGNSLACSYTVLQEVTEKSRTSVWRAVKYLREQKYIAVSKMGNCNVYHVNSNVAWSTWGNGKQYAKFSSNVIISASEQGTHIAFETNRRAALGTESDRQS